jgi:hypothetical protein
MPPSQLHTYPKTFNRWGHLRALPLRQPVNYPYVYVALGGLAFLAAYEMVRSFGF